jgi:hypothetical protein
MIHANFFQPGTACQAAQALLFSRLHSWCLTKEIKLNVREHFSVLVIRIAHDFKQIFEHFDFKFMNILGQLNLNF